MENNKAKKVALNDELLEKVAGGDGDYDRYWMCCICGAHYDPDSMHPLPCVICNNGNADGFELVTVYFGTY